LFYTEHKLFYTEYKLFYTEHKLFYTEHKLFYTEHKLFSNKKTNRLMILREIIAFYSEAINTECLLYRFPENPA
jgi:hypothetical protein